MVRQLNNSDELSAEISRLGTAGVAVIDFYADWCGPCRMVAPFFEQLSQRFSNVGFYKVNVDFTRDIAGQYGVRAMPTFVILKGGQEVHRIQGANTGELERSVSQFASTANPNAASFAERTFLQQFTVQSDRHFKYYDNIVCQTLARSVIPPEIVEEADKEATLDVAVKLLLWFKSSFFRWMDVPACTSCGQEPKKGSSLQGTPTREEAEHDAQRVEIYHCVCGAEVRFPRYNDATKLIETRAGRCGEWANCFTLFATSLGFSTRFIYDTTDHVWSELRIANKWMHFDPCEAEFDKPLLYEIGWKKKLSYVIGFGRDHVVDVTYKYSRNPQATKARRTEVRETLLTSFLDKLTLRLLTRCAAGEAPDWKDKRAKELGLEKLAELIESIRIGPVDESNYGGRISGDERWRIERGEFQCETAAAVEGKPREPFVFKVDKSNATSPGVYTATYDVVRDVYSVDAHDVVGWQACVHSIEGVQRKVENDWKMAYLCRSEGSEQGSIEWVFDINAVKVSSICIDARDFLQKDGSRIVMTACIGDTCMMVFPGTPLEISGEDISSGDGQVHVKAMLLGGGESASFQHAQLFRSSTERASPPQLSVHIRYE